MDGVELAPRFRTSRTAPAPQRDLVGQIRRPVAGNPLAKVRILYYIFSCVFLLLVVIGLANMMLRSNF
jgi:hypothetical protein